MKIGTIDKAKLATTDQEYVTLLSSNEDWIIRSCSDLDSLREAGIQPFDKLTDNDFNEFSKSLIFKGGGLGHANYKPLMRDLSLSEIFKVFAHFGLDPIKLLDYQDKKCASAGTCSYSPNDVCTCTC